MRHLSKRKKVEENSVKIKVFNYRNDFAVDTQNFIILIIGGCKVNQILYGIQMIYSTKIFKYWKAVKFSLFALFRNRMIRIKMGLIICT